EPLGVSYKSRDLFEVRGVSLMLNSREAPSRAAFARDGVGRRGTEIILRVATMRCLAANPLFARKN
ncbi:MAG TPA: hypothetical protein VE176_02490, partial [Candidatus Limnocylindrales bacterium]|nr:hypothetical protein [Candidatus Limnocylindrales bacterium]